MLSTVRINFRLLRLLLISFVLAFCSLSYEFMMAQMISALLGNTLLFYTLTIGIYIFSLGIGSLIPVSGISEERVRVKLYWIELGICLIGGWGPVWLFLINQGILSMSLGSLESYYITSCVSMGVVLVVGILSGMELPLLLRFDQLNQGGKHYISLIAFDYFASFVGSLTFAFVFFRYWGVVKSANFFALLNIACVALMFPKKQTLRFMIPYVIVVAILVYSFLNSETILSWLSRGLIGV